MSGEELARRIIQKELGRPVYLNDDGRAPSLYDLRIGSSDEPEVAIEVVGAVNQRFTETWNVGPAKSPLDLRINGDWILEITNECSVKVLLEHIESLLQELERRRLSEVRVDHWLRWDDGSLFERLNDIGIGWARCYRFPGKGNVYLTMPGIGGAVDDTGDYVPNWLGEFLRDHRRRDVIEKLTRSCAEFREVFVIVAFSGAPWLVESYLTGRIDKTPARSPDLPELVSGAWVVSGGNSRGVRWDGSKWGIFRARGVGIDD